MSADSVSRAKRCAGSRAGLMGLVSLVLLVGAPAAHAGRSEWVEVRSAHFSVYTDACSKRGQEVASQFEEIRNVFGELMRQLSVDSPTPTQIVAFRDTQQFHQFTPLWNGKPTHLSGVFVNGPIRSFILLDLSVDEPWRVVFHEYAHQLLSANFPVPVDAWFDEGFAEYFSTVKINDGEVSAGKMPAQTLAALRQGGPIKVAELFKVQRESQTYRENGPRQVLFYAQSELLVHFLIDRGWLPKVADYFDLVVGDDLTVEQAIQQAFGMSPAEFDKAIREYRKAGIFAEQHLPIQDGNAASTFSVRPVPEEESSALQTDIRLLTPDYREKTAEQLQEKLRRNPADPAICRGLGYFYLQNQDFESAEKYFGIAARANVPDARVHYYSAYLRSNRGTFGEPSALPGIFSELQRAIALDPSLADAYALMGSAELYRGDSARAVEFARKAIMLVPHNESYRYKLAQIYWLTGNPRVASEVLQPLVKTRDPELAPQVRQLGDEIRHAIDDDKDDLRENEPRRAVAGEEDPAAAPGSQPSADSATPATTQAR